MDLVALNPVVTSVVNKLFVFFYAICRGFEKQYQDTKKLKLEKSQWIIAFTDVGFDSIDKIQYGIKKCRLESPINTPSIGQFIEWCKPTLEELGIPSIDAAYAEACKLSHPSVTDKNWSHQAVYHAWSMCNSYELTHLPKKNTFPIFERNYDITIKKLVAGEPLKPIPLAITHDQEHETDKLAPKGFEHCNNYASAKDALEKMLGKKIDGSTDKNRMQKNS